MTKICTNTQKERSALRKLIDNVCLLLKLYTLFYTLKALDLSLTSTPPMPRSASPSG